MTSTFLQLTNRILKALNEVELTDSTFSSAVGFHAEAQEAVRQAVFDVYTYEDTEWPFLWDTFSFNTTIGTAEYTKDATAVSLDWDSFKITRGSASVSSITQTGGTATVTTSGAHNFLTDDQITISGATQSGYNITATITVTGSTTFTYDVDSSTVSPATGTIIATSNTVIQRKLFLIDYDKYRRDFWDIDNNLLSTEYGRPDYVARKTDNNIIISTVPDRVYSIYYEGFVIPSAISAYNDTCLVPEAFEQVVIDKAFHYAYMFRDNLEQAQLAQKRYEDNIHKMRRILIPQPTFARFSN